MNDEMARKRMRYLERDTLSSSLEHTCGAEDERDCAMMRHIIMAEIRRSNVPAWVSEELEKRFECIGCWGVLGRRISIKLTRCTQSD